MEELEGRTKVTGLDAMKSKENDDESYQSMIACDLRMHICIETAFCVTKIAWNNTVIYGFKLS